jgi:hypothetical protein
MLLNFPEVLQVHKVSDRRIFDFLLVSSLFPFFRQQPREDCQWTAVKISSGLNIFKLLQIFRFVSRFNQLVLLLTWILTLAELSFKFCSFAMINWYIPLFLAFLW